LHPKATTIAKINEKIPKEGNDIKDSPNFDSKTIENLVFEKSVSDVSSLNNSNKSKHIKKHRTSE
jgi:hypothetical protein